MANRTALMEWLEQTKRISKEEDYMGLEIIDNVMANIHLICPELIRRHRKFFNDLCNSYHKPNPVSYLSDHHKTKAFKSKYKGLSFYQWQASFCRKPEGYPKGGCRAFKHFRKAVTEQLEIQIERFKKAQKIIQWQWFEVIDFMYERPELVNPALIDEYMTQKINEVCADGKKNNPLANGLKARFGKFWKDKEGKWQPEKRQRF
jgi:hypothetical protein